VRLAPTIPIEDLTEAQFSAQVVELARLFGWTHIYHTWRSKHSAAGFPDYVLVRERVVFCELKTERGKLSDAQRDWLEALNRAGQEAYCFRPHDLDLIADILRRRERAAA
jgi:hypothetical protein